MGTGTTSLNRIGDNISDSFLDSYTQETFVCCDIIDKMALHSSTYITVTFNKVFLKKILKSHIQFIRQIENDGKC